MSSKYRGFSQSSDSGRNYSSGAWGSGDLDGAALANKYGLDTSQEGRGEGHIWGRNADGSEVYIGKSNMGLASNQDLIANHSKQANSGEIDHSSVPDNLSSFGDIKGAILTEWAGGNAAAAPTKEKAPVVLSERAAKAKAYTAAYEDVMLPRQGERIFGRENNRSVVDDFDAQYSLNLKKESQPQTPAALSQAESEADPVEAQAKSYAKDYKLALGDMLRPANRDFT
tara:strand:+ start:1606 stop:2286 length:681 start_codon:yes stop_codon:yes gene_type:complete